MLSRHSRRTAAAACLAVSLVAAACGGGDKKDPVASGSPSASTSKKPTPSPSKSEGPLRSPFTGRAVDQLNRVLAIKIDNARAARPQAGLDKADIVYEELVEGGTTRFLAIFSSQEAPVLGPVRSVRETDMPLLRQFGTVLFAFSGGSPGVARIARNAPLIDASVDAAPGAYYRNNSRPAPYNLFTASGRLFAAKTAGVKAQDVGFRFGAGNYATSTKASQVSLTWSKAAKTYFTYDPKTLLWSRGDERGPAMLTSGARMSTPNIVLMHCLVVGGNYRDTAGNLSPFTHTQGKGTVEVFRDGTRTVGTWSRPAPFAGTSLRDRNGKTITLRPGPVWVLLAPQTSSVGVG